MTDGRAVLVTGAAGGIGSVTARALAAEGFHVFAGVRDPERAVTETFADHPEGIEPIHLDVTSPDSVEEAVAKVPGPGRRLSGVVNAATAEYHGPLEILPMEFVRHELEVNYLGPLTVTRAVTPHLRACGGRVVNISSINGLCVFPSIGASCAAKYALEAASDALRMELRRWGIRVVLVNPGAVRTQLWPRSLRAFESLPDRVHPDRLRLYYPAWDQAVERARADQDRMLKLAAQPARVSAAIVHALTSARPRGRYLVGWDARMLAAARWILPARAFDALALHTFRE
ncbi:SDR family NAD(P)-dependent oxidoreductase [Nonomuraea sp. NPDC050790]|uniref:SDR family NAD(P)-dependent oxidoreductase n=1 Tax=Nonomuraea sp. NPDC050790 TaxID=3364371 RepID=UPI00379BF64B